MLRVVEDEALDGLPADDAAAMRSRRDLQRIHRVMGTRRALCRVLADCLKTACTSTAAPKSTAEPLRVLELGAGDGSLLLGVAEALHSPSRSRPVELCLLDRQPLVVPATIERFSRAGWTARVWVGEVDQWVAGEGGMPPQSPTNPTERWNLILANLFLHHFPASVLSVLFGAIAQRCDRFFAIEPRRGWVALAGSHLVGALGANAVTRGDAVLSVHAGFAGQELSALWPAPQRGWRLHEHAMAPFSHGFEARRSETA